MPAADGPWRPVPIGVEKLQRVGRFGKGGSEDRRREQAWSDAAEGAGRGGPRTGMDWELPVEAPNRGVPTRKAERRLAGGVGPLTGD